MSRPNQPWWWKQRRCWYVWVDGVQVKLDPDRDAAFRKWYEIKAGVQPHPTEMCCGDAFALFLPTTDEANDPEYPNRYRTVVAEFARDHARVPVASLSPDHLAAFVAARRHRWKSESTRALVAALVKRFGHWLVERKYVASDPFAGCRVGRVRSRGADILPDRATVEAFLLLCGVNTRDVLTAILDTGCRPVDACRVSAAEFDPAARVWVLRKHKTVKKTGRPRVVHLTDRVVRACQTRSSRHPTGPLYRTVTDRPWNTNALASTLLWYQKRHAVDRFPLYSLRHLFATDALERGVPDAVVAELLGHSVDVLHRHYAHLVSRTATLKDALNRVRGQSGDEGKKVG